MMISMMIRSAFERTLRKNWSGVRLVLRYWDGRQTVIDGHQPAVTIIIKSPAVIRQLLVHQSLGFGHGYTAGTIEIQGDLQELLRSAFGRSQRTPPSFFSRAAAALPRRTSPQQAKANARFHYDNGNTFFSLWLDPSLTYSCAYFRTEQDRLEQAQQQKRELICRKLELAEGQTLLDVGCGWGALLFHAIEHYGVRGVGVTPSRQQADYINQEAKRRNIPLDNLTLHVTDWRSVTGMYDRVVSVGMYEHVGKAHGRQFFRKWRQWVKPDGVSLLHTIGAMDSRGPDPWINENIFPGGYLPSLAQLASHARDNGLVITDVENLWRHYALTLQSWAANFDRARQEISALTSEEFTRRWWLYLNASEAAFTTGRLVLWQIVITPGKRASQPLTRKYMLAKVPSVLSDR